MVAVVEFLDERGRSPFRRWFDRLDPSTAARVTVALYRIEHGATSAIKGLGAGLLEYRIDAGPGYRLYLVRPDEHRFVLLGGGIKRTQARDIASCRARLEQIEHRKLPERPA